MKKYILTIFAVLSLVSTQAQVDGYLIYKEYEQTGIDIHLGDQAFIDINEDGMNDITIYLQIEPHEINSWVVKPMDSWKCCYLQKHIIGNNPKPNVYDEPDLPLNDTTLGWYIRAYQYENVNPMEFKVGMRIQEGEDYYYGWAYFLLEIHNYEYYTYYLQSTCFCTIPNYPLVWGQKSLDWTSVEKTDDLPFRICPNPAKGCVTVSGTQIAEVRLHNVAGQLVATQAGNGTESLTIDISSLPSGLYFVTVTGQDGKMSVQKVVKE